MFLGNSMVSAFSGCNSVLKSSTTATLTTRTGNMRVKRSKRSSGKRNGGVEVLRSTLRLCHSQDSLQSSELPEPGCNGQDIRYMNVTLMSKFSKLYGIRWYRFVLLGLLMVHVPPMNMLSSTAPLGSSARASNLRADTTSTFSPLPFFCRSSRP